MHSSFLRGSDFRLRWRGEAVAHDEFFRAHRTTTRLGILTSAPTDGIGAVSFAMACVTAFYDRYRARQEDFFAYPDFFTFQRQAPVADYGSLDFWPEKDVLVADTADATAAALVERAINVLLVPANARGTRPCERVHVEGLRRNIGRCFSYDARGDVPDADLTIDCDVEPFRSYARRLLGSLGRSDASPAWVADPETRTFKQSFRELAFAEMLAHL